jgi:hypothetical protein
MNILTIGFTYEGKTDFRFLSNIIKRTFESLAFECKGQVEVYEPRDFLVKEDHFVNDVIAAARNAKYINILCVHVDADSDDDLTAVTFKIVPTLNAINELNETICKNLVAVIPVRMTEAWMLADRDVLRQELSSFKTNEELKLPTRYHQIERLSDPKETIENAIRIAFDEIPKRRKRIKISELYSPISQKINLEILENLPSYNKFKSAAREALRRMNYLE